MIDLSKKNKLLKTLDKCLISKTEENAVDIIYLFYE